MSLGHLKAVPILAALALSFSGVVPGVCAVLCQTQVCCAAKCDPEPTKPCCKHEKKSTTCCQRMAQVTKSDPGTPPQSLAPSFLIPILDTAPEVPTLVVMAWSEPVLVEGNERAPPGPCSIGLFNRGPPELRA